MISSLLVIVPFLAGINAANDWKVPCISGSCSYDMPGTASGSLKIWGSEDAITDITTAADWHIIGCDPNALSQDIRLVCANPDDPDSKCGHLYQNIGAVNKLVRLPENCGASAFARISKAWVPEDQSIPASLQSRIVRRDGKQPVVKALALDTNFDAVDWSKTGVVNIAIQGANVPGAPTDIKTPGSRRASRSRRGFGDAIKSVTDGVKNAAEKAKEAVKDAAGATGDKAKEAADKTKEAAKAAADKAKEASDKAAKAAADKAKEAADKTKEAAKAAADKAKEAGDKTKDAAKAAADKAKEAGDKTKDAAKAAADKAKEAGDKAKDAAKAAADKAASAAKGAATKVESKAKDAATKIASGAKAAATQVGKGAKSAADAAAEAAKAAANNTINVNKAFDLKPLVFNKAVNLIDQSLSCGATSASLRVDMDANANAQASISVAATGTIVPPKMSSFGIVAGLTADVAGTLTMNADLSGRLDSGKINLVTLGVPGFSFPGILTIGPSFKVDAQIVGDVDVAMDMTVGINFNVKNAQLAFPPDAKNKPEEKAFSIGDTPLTLNAAPNVQATGTITAHLIPSLNLGVSALGNKAKAQIFLALDTNAALTMNLDASGDITKVKNNNNAAAGGAAAGTTDETAEETTTDETATDEAAAETTDETVTDEAAAADATTEEPAADEAATDETTDETAAADATIEARAEDEAAAADETAAADATTEEAATDEAATDETAATDDTAAETTDETATDETATDGELEPIDNASTGGAATDDTAVPDGTTTSKSFGGCVQVDGAINVLAGAEGSFFGLFNKVKSVPLFNKNFRILNKCFGDQATAAKAEAETEKQAAAAEAADAAATIKNASADAAAADKTTDAAAPKRRSASSISVSRRASLGARAVLSCPIGGRKSKSSLTKGTVKSSAIKTKTKKT